MLSGDLQFELGSIRIEVDSREVTACRFLRRESQKTAGISSTPSDKNKDSRLLQQALEQIDQYLHGGRKTFKLPIRLEGTSFQRQVWSALQKLPFGELCSYGDLARMIKRPRAARAVGNAVGANRHLLLVPCHRVIESNGGLGGFGCGLDIKKFLLAIEGRNFN